MTNQEYKNLNMVCLYIFTHKITGLKYFGKTTLHFTIKDLLKYGGSGSYWHNHKRKHGNYLSVEIYGIYSINEVKEIALKFSSDNNIVGLLNESGDRKGKKVWANEKDENGLDGNPKGFRHKEETKLKMGTRKENHPFYGKERSKETKLKISMSNSKPDEIVKCPHCLKEGGKVNMSRYHFDNCGKPIKGRKQTKDEKDKRSRTLKGRSQKTTKCPHCLKEGSISNMKRWHFDNCKSIM